MQTTAGIVPINQPTGIKPTLREILTAQSDWTIAALGVIVPALGSIILGLALIAGALEPQAACDVAALDELWQEEQWGTDMSAVSRRKQIYADVLTSIQFLSLCAT
jgi:chaperone required for assembly of F1-ATPase